MPDTTPLRMLILDEQPAVRQLCAAIAGRLGLECVQADSADAVLQEMASRPAELIVAELQDDGSAGLQLLMQVKRRWPLAEVILMSAYGSPESAVQAMRLGAYDFVVKPFRIEEFQLVLERMAEKARLVRENRFLRHRLQGRTKSTSTTMASCTDLEELERMTVQRVFQQVDGNKQEAQRLLGISRATLYRKIKRYGIEGASRTKTVANADMI